MKLTEEDLHALEGMIDLDSLAGVLRAIRDICDGKAAHLTEKWQDDAAAALWSKAAVQVGNAAERSAVVYVSQR